MAVEDGGGGWRGELGDGEKGVMIKKFKVEGLVSRLLTFRVKEKINF